MRGIYILLATIIVWKCMAFILYNLYIGVSIPSKWAEVEEGSALLKPVVPTFPVN